MPHARDNFKAGVFVIVGVALALVVILLLSDLERLFGKQQRVSVYYALSDGVRGLKEGAAVTLGDQPVGTVTAIEDWLPDGSRVEGKMVRVSLPARYKLCQDAAVELVQPPLGSGTRLNIRSVGAGAPYDDSGEAIRGQLAGSPLTESLVKDFGIEEEQRQKFQKIIDDIARLTTAISDSESEGEVPIETMVQHVAAAARDLPDTTGRAKAVLDEARQTMAKLNETVAEIKAVVTDFREVTAEFKDRSGPWWDRLDAATEAVDTLATLVKDKEQTLRETVDDVGLVSRRLRAETMDQVAEALTKADQAVESVRKAATELEVLASGQRPVLERAIANAQITTGQLKLAAIEIRRSPWRLMYTPKDEELETDNLYDAARSFAMAAGALDTAAESLRAVAGRQAAGSKEQTARMLDRLERLFGKFEEAEGAFWKALKPGERQAPEPGSP